MKFLHKSRTVLVAVMILIIWEIHGLKPRKIFQVIYLVLFACYVVTGCVFCCFIVSTNLLQIS